MKGAENMEEFHYMQLESSLRNASAGGNSSAPVWNGPVRGEKQWQQWAGDNNEYLDGQVNVSNTRPPYLSTVQLMDGKGPSWTVRGEKQW